MKIWIDGYEANVPQRLGSSQVAFELICNLEKIDVENEYTILLPASPLGDLPEERTGWKYKILRPKRLWTRIALPLALYTAKQKPDIFFSPTHYIPRFAPTKVKRVVTIFDLSFLHFPEMFIQKDLWQLKNWTKFSAENADHIITISKFSKDDICKQYKLIKEKITVAYPGYDTEKFFTRGESSFGRKVEEIKKKYGIEGNYIMYVGTIQPRKNLIRLMEAFAGVVRDVSGLKLVIIGKTEGEGKQGWMYEDTLQAPQKLGIESKVKFLGFVPTEDLSVLLSGATAFIQPSLWEGFGIPVVEAMATGTPVIVSNVSSLPEVVGKAGLLVDPYSVDQMEQAIRTIVSDKKLHQRYSKEGIARAKVFSWDKMAQEVLKVFEKIEKS
ncbi:MAG: glycosyltransferase family 1 protein [Candidatus Daviesbacteria bacterium]|nr:glycosyltransferase family 1 protein [Candidatus Daviesbacteria bacterium]